MDFVTLIIDSRATDTCACGAPTSLLPLPLGERTFLERLVERLGTLVSPEGRNLWVMPTFSVDEAYAQNMLARFPEAEVLDSDQLPEKLRSCRANTRVVVFDPQRWPRGDFHASSMLRKHGRDGQAVHFVGTGKEEVRARERVEHDDAGRVTRVQRVYRGNGTAEAGETGVFMSSVPAGVLADISFSTVPQLRAALVADSVPVVDVPVPVSVVEIDGAEGVLALNEIVMRDELGGATRTGATGEATVVCGADCSIDPTARMIGPVVLHDRVRVGAGATIVGPAVLGPACEVEPGAIVAQAVLAAGTLVRGGVTLRHCVAAGRCLACPEGTRPRQAQRQLGAGGRPKGTPAQTGRTPYQPTRSRRIDFACKRLVDIVASACGLIVLSPLFVVVAIAIKWASPGPVFFVHRREQRGGKEFPCLKFRTMVADAHAQQLELYAQNEVDGPQFKLRNDPRVTKLGDWLRAKNIDELPQLVNVLLGHMSLVGPRPSPFRENQICVPWRRARLSVRPGITGLWQICRSADRSAGDFHEWIYYDIAYVRHFSWWLDIKILAATIWTRGGRTSVPMSRLISDEAQKRSYRSRVAML